MDMTAMKRNMYVISIIFQDKEIYCYIKVKIKHYLSIRNKKKINKSRKRSKALLQIWRNLKIAKKVYFENKYLKSLISSRHLNIFVNA